MDGQSLFSSDVLARSAGSATREVAGDAQRRVAECLERMANVVPAVGLAPARHAWE